MTYALTLRQNNSHMVTFHVQYDFTIRDLAGMYIVTCDDWHAYSNNDAAAIEKIGLQMQGLTKKRVIKAAKDFVATYGGQDYYDEQDSYMKAAHDYAELVVQHLFE